MPLLANPQYFELAKHGHVRGGEAVIFVERVRLYHDMLKHLGLQQAPYFPSMPFGVHLPSEMKLSLP